MFFNTGIATYIWLLDNNKQSERRGRVQLIDASSMWTKMRKGMGSKRKEIDASTRERIVKLYDAFGENQHSKILKNSDFGYWTITVERPLRLNFSASRAADLDDKALGKALGKATSPAPFLAVLAAMGEQTYLSQDKFIEVVREEFAAAGLKLTPAQYRHLAIALGEPDELAEVVTDGKGNPEPDVRKRFTENIPFTYGGNTLGDAGRNETVKKSISKPRWPHTSLTPGSTLRRRRSATRFPSPGCFTRIPRRAPWQKSTATWKPRSPRSLDCCERWRRDARTDDRAAPRRRTTS
ncbi:hypothetical protein GCM10020256_40090 [Streptomyces thermocoprophilus]